MRGSKPGIKSRAEKVEGGRLLGGIIAVIVLKTPDPVSSFEGETSVTTAVSVEFPSTIAKVDVVEPEGRFSTSRVRGTRPSE